MHRGWVRLWRKVKDSAVWNDDLFRLWCHCILEADHKDGWANIDGLAAPVEVVRGQFITGRFALHSGLYPKKRKSNPSASTVWRRLQTLEKLENLTIKTNSRFSMVTLIEYDTYNPAQTQVEQPVEQPVNSQRTAGEQPVNTLKEHNNQRTSNNGKKKPAKAGPVYSEEFILWWKQYPQKVGKLKALTAYEASIARVKVERGFQPVEAHQHLLTAARAFAASDKGRGQYVPHPTTFLNEGRYDDDPSAWQDSKSEPQDDGPNSPYA